MRRNVQIAAQSNEDTPIHIIGALSKDTGGKVQGIVLAVPDDAVGNIPLGT